MSTSRLTAHELAMKMIRDVLATTGITATAGIGTNMYLAKVAMDIVAKKAPADKDGVRIAELDEITTGRPYQNKLTAPSISRSLHHPHGLSWRVLLNCLTAM